MTHSADFWSDVRLCDDKVRIGDNHLIDVVGYGTLTAVFPGDLTVKLLDVAYVPDIAFNLFALMAAHKHGVGIESNETAVDINGFHCVYGHFNESLLRETAKSLDVKLLGKLRPCTGCSMAKGYRKPIPRSTKTRA
ncbi:unnamed protein product [Laminaria digitata]